MADDFEALWNSTPAMEQAAPVAAAAPTFDDLWASTPATPSGVMPALGEVGQGLTFGFLDEIEGGTNALANLMGNVVGLGNNRSFSENYTTTRDATRAELGAYEEANPLTSMALQVGGGVIPSIAGGIATATGKAATKVAPSLFGNTLKNVLGVVDDAPSVMQLAKMGGTQGALYGAGNATEGSRLEGALTGGAIGTVAAPVIGKPVEWATKSISDRLANMGIIGAGGADLASETGSFSTRPAGTSYTPEELFLAKQLKNTPLEKVQAGAAEMAAVGDDVPLFLPEALNSPKVDRNARFIANYEPSMEFSQSAIAGRTATAEERATQLFNKISENPDSYEGASGLVKAAREIVQSAEDERQALVKPMYGAAYEAQPVVTDDAFKVLLEKDKVLQTAINSVKKTANNADLPENSSALLVKARQEISNKIDSALSKGAGREARDLTDTYNRLNNILHKNPELKAADEAYATASENISALTDTFLSNLTKITDDKVQNVSQIFTQLPAERIKTLRNTFEAAGKLNEWDAGIKAHLQNVVEGTGEGKNFTHKLTGNTLQENKLQAALGDKYDEVAKGLSYENRFFEGKKKYYAGSSTEGNQQENRDFQKGVGVISKLLSGNKMDAIKQLFVGDFNEDLAQELAKIYFDPKKGRNALEKILPLLEQYGKNSTISAQLGSASTRPAIAQSSQSASQEFQGKGLIPSQEASSGLKMQNGKAQGSAADWSIPDSIKSYIDSAGSPSLNNTASSNPNLESAFKKVLGEDMYKNQPVKQVIEAVKSDPVDFTIAMMESGKFDKKGNFLGLDPEAKNQTSTASGLFQLIKKTARNLGVKDVFDAGDNYDGYLKLKQTAIDKYGVEPSDYKSLYSFHYLGETAFRKLINGESLNKDQKAQVQFLQNVLLPKLDKYYQIATKETRQVMA